MPIRSQLENQPYKPASWVTFQEDTCSEWWALTNWSRIMSSACCSRTLPILFRRDPAPKWKNPVHHMGWWGEDPGYWDHNWTVRKPLRLSRAFFACSLWPSPEFFALMNFLIAYAWMRRELLWFTLFSFSYYSLRVASCTINVFIIISIRKIFFLFPSGQLVVPSSILDLSLSFLLSMAQPTWCRHSWTDCLGTVLYFESTTLDSDALQHTWALNYIYA